MNKVLNNLNHICHFANVGFVLIGLSKYKYFNEEKQDVIIT